VRNTYYTEVKIKLSLCLINWAPHHENTWGSRGTAPPLFTSALKVSGQLHAPATLSPGKEPPPFQRRSQLRGEQKNLAPARSRTPAIHPIAVAIPTELSWLH
jgi:hypothetical protein